MRCLIPLKVFVGHDGSVGKLQKYQEGRQIRGGVEMKIAVLGLIIFLIHIPVVHAFDPAPVFEKKCSSCHTIGNGDSIGPDLKDVTKRRSAEWLIKFIPSPEGMVSDGDPIATELYNKAGKKFMPDQSFSESEIKAILKFVESGGVGEVGKVKSALEATSADILAGEQIFIGATQLSAGGPACLSCHSAGSAGVLGGGTLALDLTSVYSKYKDSGISAALKNIAFPVMQKVYEDYPLTDDEIFQIKAYLYQTDKVGAVVADHQKKFLFLAFGGVVLMLGLIDLTWRRRRKHAVKNYRGGRS